jgi:Holliday junction resolvasome RuvABC endonuclease subunit
MQSPEKQIKLEKREKPLIRVMGIDPGFRSLGIAILEQIQGQMPKVLSLRVIETEKKSGKKALVATRVSTDDQRRLSEIWEALEEEVADPERRPFAVGVEAYRPFAGRGGGNAWKSAVAYGFVSSWARARGWPLFVFLPEDLKIAFTRSRSASKEEVAEAMCLKVSGLREKLERLPEVKREHVADAAGHAYLVLVEIAKNLVQFPNFRSV